MAEQNQGAAGGAKVASGKVVKYVGTADVREIDANAWRNVGVEDQGKLVWDAKNKHTIPVADISKGALQYLDETDAGFVVTDADV
jgi:hypothetical protein